ncbi:MAG: hypothetical protein LBK45_05845 [Tannerellaceae bacterium]|nr:hypothetical protein [Tannerellaceae bacterium]
MKQYLILLFLFSTTSIFSQLGILNEFVIEKYDNPHKEIFDLVCERADGVIVFSTAIPNLKFSIPVDPDRLKNVSPFDKEKNRYVLCVQPTDTEIGQISLYSISITAEGFKESRVNVTNVRAVEAQYIKIDPKNVIEEEKNFDMALGVGSGITIGGIGSYARLKYRRVGLEVGMGLSDFEDKSLHWSVGAKLFPFRPGRGFNLSGICMSVHYGTINTEKTDTYYYNNGEFGVGKVKLVSGWSALVGYDARLARHINLNTGVGFSYADQASFAWKIGIGWAF